MVEAANVAAFGSLWVVQFVILDRFLFKPRPEEAIAVATGDGRTNERPTVLEAA